MFIRNKHILILFLICKVTCLPNLTFVIDESFSMQDDVEDVISAVSSVIDIFSQENVQIGNIALVTFNDREARLINNTCSHKDLMLFLTRSTPANDDYNYECSESVLSGVKLALELSLPQSYIFVFTDASAKDYKKSREIERLCEKKQSQVVFVLTGDCRRVQSKRFQVYYDIATASSGLAFRVEKNEIEAVYPAISETVGYTKVILAAETLAGNRTEVPFEINEDIEYAIVSACINVSLEISGAFNQSVVVEEIMWKNHGKVVKVKDPGEYVATVRSVKSTSVVVTGWTNFHFYYGFSEQRPQLLEDTELEPYSNKASYLSLFVTDLQYSLEEPSAQILDEEQNIIEKLPLKEIRPNFYITKESFTVPNVLFKIAITGRVAGTGKTFRRIAKASVTPKEQPSDIHHDVYLLNGTSTTLKCGLQRTNSSSAVMWFINDEYMGTMEYLSVENAQIGHDANYTCLVSGINGNATETFEVDVGYPPSLKYPDADPIVHWKGPTEDELLRCDVNAKPLESVEWTFNGKPLVGKGSTELTLTDWGHYSCKVWNIHGTVQRDFKVIPATDP